MQSDRDAVVMCKQHEIDKNNTYIQYYSTYDPRSPPVKGVTRCHILSHYLITYHKDYPVVIRELTYLDLKMTKALYNNDIYKK